jgi:hypothetical protein
MHGFRLGLKSFEYHYSKSNPFQDYVNMCKQNITNITKVPTEFANMKLINAVGRTDKLWKIVSLTILNHLAPDAQDHFINNVWLTDSSFESKWSTWNVNEVNHPRYQILSFKILDNIFSSNVTVLDSSRIPQTILGNPTFTSYIIGRITGNNLINFPLSVFNGAQLTGEQFNRLNSLYNMRMFIRCEPLVSYNACTINGLLLACRGLKGTTTIAPITIMPEYELTVQDRNTISILSGNCTNLTVGEPILLDNYAIQLVEDEGWAADKGALLLYILSLDPSKFSIDHLLDQLFQKIKNANDLSGIEVNGRDFCIIMGKLNINLIKLAAGDAIHNVFYL